MKNVFVYPNCEAALSNMEQTLTKLEGLVNCKLSLEGISIIRKQLQRPARFVETMKNVFISNSMNARNDIKKVSYNPTNVSTIELPGDVAKYKVLYERQVEMLGTVSAYEKSCMQIKSEVSKMNDLIKRLCDYVEKIDNVLADQMIPEVIRRIRWEQMSQDYLKKYREWVNLEDTHREEFFSMFKFNDMPEVFGQLLISEYQIPNDSFAENPEYKGHLESLTGFFDESKKFYSEWSQNLKEICKTTHVSILRREKVRTEKENESLAKQLGQARETLIDKQKEIENMRSELDDLINKNSTTGVILIDERTKAEDLRNEIQRISDLNSLQDASIKKLKAERDSLISEVMNIKETSMATIAELQDRLNTNETELKAFIGVISDKNQEIEELKKSGDSMQSDGTGLRTDLEVAKQKLKEVEGRLTTITEVKNSLVKENTKLKEELQKKS